MTDGPPISNREVVFVPSILEHSVSWIIGLLCLFIAFQQYRQNQGGWKFRFFSTIGALSLITSPWLGSLHKVVIGAYPTIDKEGSLLFFEHGVHHLWFTNLGMPIENTGLTLIGVHIGHLWITEIFSTVAPTFVAFNVQACTHLLLNTLAILYWIDGYDWVKGREWEKWIVALVLGAQLHVFRDIHWYTIEKSALFPIFIFWGTLVRQGQGQDQGKWWHLPVAYLLAGLYNFYWAILCPLLVLTEYKQLTAAFINKRPLAKGLLICGSIGIGLALLQMSLQTPHHRIAPEDEFAIRASLDVFSVWPIDWNRMGLWRPVNLVLICLGLSRSRRYHRTENPIPNLHGLMLCGVLGLLLSLGPSITASVPNPVYRMFMLLPGMWRFAKPEIFFLIPYAVLGLLALRTEWPKWIWVLVLGSYLIGLYSSPAFPYLTEFIEGKLHF